MAAFDVFLSHNSIDKPWVVQLKDDLTRYGLRVWLDKDEIRPGDLFAKALEDALENCSAIALIISQEAMDSGWVEEEYCRAVSLSKGKQPPLQIIPVILREAEVTGFIQSRNWIDFRDESNYSENVWKLVWGILGHKPREVLDLTAPIRQPTQQPDLRTQRYLDAAISQKVKLGQTTELIVLIRLPDSQGLRALIAPDGDYQIQPEDLKSKKFQIEFPVDYRGKQLPLNLCIEIETIDFVVAERRKFIKLEGEKDSSPCIFLLTTKRRGPLKILVQVYLVQEELLLATGLLNVNGATRLDQGIQNLKALISIPLGVFGVGGKKSIDHKFDVVAPAELDTPKRISANGPVSAGEGDAVDMRGSKNAVIFNQKGQKVGTQTNIGKMSGGFVQPGMTVHGNVQQAGRDFHVGDQYEAGRDIHQASQALSKLFEDVLKRVAALPAQEQKVVKLAVESVRDQVSEIQQNGIEDEASPQYGKLKRGLKTLVEWVPDIADVVLSFLKDPATGIVTAVRMVADRIKSEVK